MKQQATDLNGRLNLALEAWGKKEYVDYLMGCYRKHFVQIDYEDCRVIAEMLESSISKDEIRHHLKLIIKHKKKHNYNPFQLVNKACKNCPPFDAEEELRTLLQEVKPNA